MAEAPVVHVSRLLDERGISGIHVQLIVWSVLIALFDGYDISAIALAAPHLVREWHIDRASLGPVLAASNIGVLFGSMLFGWIGDRYGRKTALIQSLLLFGILTWLAAHASSLQEMFWLRLIAGLGIGGVIPNMIAINIESAPRRSRATLGLIATGLVPLGGALPGFVSAALVPHYGWQILFLIGGVAPVAIGICAFFWMPESIKYMSIRESHRGKLTRLLERLAPGYRVPEAARFVIEDERQSPSSNPKYLFAEGLAVITPLLWLLFALNLMGFFFLLLWTPTLLTAAKLPPATAALTIASLQVGGTVGTLALIGWIQRRQFLAVAILFLIGRRDRLHWPERFSGHAAGCKFYRGRVRARRAVRNQCLRRACLSDVAARARLGMGTRHRTARLDCRAAGGRVFRDATRGQALHVVGDAVPARRPDLLCGLPPQSGSDPRAPLPR